MSTFIEFLIKVFSKATTKILMTTARRSSAIVMCDKNPPTVRCPVYLENRLVGFVLVRMAAFMMPRQRRMEAGERNPKIKRLNSLQ